MQKYQKIEISSYLIVKKIDFNCHFFRINRNSMYVESKENEKSVEHQIPE